MKLQINDRDRQILRELACRQMEYAALPIMSERLKRWRRLNDGEQVCPPVAIETWTFENEFLPDSVFQCESDTARDIERQLLTNIRRHELINDDQPVPSVFQIHWDIEIDRFGIQIPTEYSPDSSGRQVGYRQQHPIQNLEQDLEKLRPARVTINKAVTWEYKAAVEDLLLDIMPVEICGPSLEIHLTYHLIALMGMELLYTSLYDDFDKIDWLMEYICENQKAIFNSFEANGLLRLNNRNHHIATSYITTERLPLSGYNGNVRLKDLWGWAEAEETAGLSPKMFCEHFLPYYQKMSTLVGRIYYGCCEPMQGSLNEILKAIPNIGKVSVSSWNDEQEVGRILAGRGVVYSRKPSANYLGVEENLDEQAFVQSIKKTLLAAKDCPCEFIFRDIYTVHNNMDKVRRAVEIVREIAS